MHQNKIWGRINFFSSFLVLVTSIFFGVSWPSKTLCICKYSSLLPPNPMPKWTSACPRHCLLPSQYTFYYWIVRSHCLLDMILIHIFQWDNCHKQCNFNFLISKITLVKTYIVHEFSCVSYKIVGPNYNLWLEIFC